ncbi:sensor histidine kinase [Listeria sp. PSOL-1]|uniref:sensor histidine kinase n=1 Tax=Listeria sp. PSOL-1 TaxID=1844999 RepID=UPI0013D4BC0B|nr:histidine kinase [Listeria sp. PSOL-1]
MNSYKLGLDALSTFLIAAFILITETNGKVLAFYLLMLLIYLSLQILADVFLKMKIVFVILSAGLLFWGSIHGFLVLLLLFPFALFSLLLQEKAWQKKRFVLVIILALLPVFLLKDQLMLLFFCGITTFVFLFDQLLYRYDFKSVREAELNEALRLKTRELSVKIELMQSSFKREMGLAKMEERNQLTHQIHDELGHTLTGGLMQLEAAKAILTTDPKKAQELMQNAIQINAKGIEQIRQVLKNSKPKQESIAVDRLRLILDKFEEDYQIRTLFHTSGNMDAVTQPMWYVFIENLNEALTNVLRYSQATRVNVSVHVLNKIVRFEIKDNGKGAVDFDKHLGLIGMEERAAKLGGRVTFNTTIGFEILTLIPR